MKKFLYLALTAIMACAVFLGGCFITSGADGKDGKNGQDISVNDLYEAAKSIEGNENLTLDEFLKQYLSFDSATLEQSAALQTSINRSLLSGVSILSRFTYNDTLGYVDGNRFPFGGSAGTSIGNPDYHIFGLGAGVIVDLDKTTGDAYVITNCHVVCDDSSKEKFSQEVYLFLYGQDTEGVNYDIDGYCMYGNKRVYYKGSDGNEYYLPDQSLQNADGFSIPATVVGASVTYDIALLKVTGSEVLKNSVARAAEFEASDDVYMGQQVYAVGNPRGYGMSATAGIISKDSEEIAINMSETDSGSYNTYRVIRTDAAINGGNSGGGLYNSSGNLIGIVNSKSVSDDIDNMGYALPSSNVKRLYRLMRENYENGSVFGNSNSGINRAFPVANYEIADTDAYYNKTTGLVEIEEKVKVTKSGGNLEAGDVIKHIKITNGSNVVEDTAVTRMYHFEDALVSVRNGYTVTVTVSRGGEDVEVNMGYTFIKLS